MATDHLVENSHIATVLKGDLRLVAGREHEIERGERPLTVIHRVVGMNGTFGPDGWITCPHVMRSVTPISLLWSLYARKTAFNVDMVDGAAAIVWETNGAVVPGAKRLVFAEISATVTTAKTTSPRIALFMERNVVHDEAVHPTPLRTLASGRSARARVPWLKRLGHVGRRGK